MKSKITIDVDLDNQPILRIEYFESDDVRDKLVRRFLDTLPGQRGLCITEMIDSGSRPMVRTDIIRPMSINEMDEQLKVWTEWMKGWAKVPEVEK